MKGFFKSIPNVGPMKLEYVFYEYEVPTLFVCVDNAQRRYLCACCKLGEEWLVGQVSEDTLVLMIEDSIALDEVFKKKSNAVFPLSWDGQHLVILPDIEQDMYPAPGALLELSDEEDVLQYKRYLRAVMLRKTVEPRRIKAVAVSTPDMQHHAIDKKRTLNSSAPALLTTAKQLEQSIALASRINVQQTIAMSASLSTQLSHALEVATPASQINIQHIVDVVSTLSKLDMQHIKKTAALVSQSVGCREALSNVYNKVYESGDCRLENIAIEKVVSQQNVVAADVMILLAA